MLVKTFRLCCLPYLGCSKIEAVDYHVEHGSLTIQRSKKVETLPGEFVFPLRALIEASEPRAEQPQERAIPQERAVPFESELRVPGLEEDYTQEQLLEDLAAARRANGEEEPAAVESEPSKESATPDGRPIPEGHHWDGVRIVKTYKGSKRPKHIPSDYWVMLDPKSRKQIIREEEEKAKASSSGGASSSESKRATVAKLASKRCPDKDGILGVGTWEVIPENGERFAVPAMPIKHENEQEEHRLPLRQLVEQRIKQIEFQQVFEFFAVVARLVSKEEIANNPKARAALDKEWENLRTKGVWDEARVRECRRIIREAHASGSKVHLGRIFEACYEKGSELPDDHPERKFKGRTVFQGNNVRDENSDHALFAEMGSSPASMEAAKILDAFGSQPGYAKEQADAVQAYIQALFTGVPTWVSLPRNRWPKHWEKEYVNPMVPLVLALYGHPDGGGIWEQHLNNRIAKKGWQQILPEVWNSIFYNPEYKCMLVVYVDDFKIAGPKENLAKAWKTIRDAVNVGEPEPYSRYFGCHHQEFNNIKLPKEAHPFSHVFEAKTAAVCQQHRVNDYWEHDAQAKTWTRHHLQPRKKFYDPRGQGGDVFEGNLGRVRYTVFDESVTLKGCPCFQVEHASDDACVVSDNMDEKQVLQANEFWTGRTVFTYGEKPNVESFAMASPQRQGPHRVKRDAKNEVKAKRFKPLEEANPHKSGCMTKPVNIVRYDMSAFLGSCVEAYCTLAGVKPEALNKAQTPFNESGLAKPLLEEDEKPGRLQPIASKVLMKVLFAARMARYDLLRATQSLASRVTKWSADCDLALHRLISYINTTKDSLFLEGFIGDDFENCQLWLFADADWGGEKDSKSTSGCSMILVGPNTYYPLNAFSKKQTVISTSSTEAEVVSANHAIRAEGIPTLALFEQLGLLKKEMSNARFVAEPKEDEVFAYIDPELDEIRYGNVDSGHKISNINSLKAHFPEFSQVKVMEDNQATITVVATGNSQSMRHANRTQRISFRWLKQQFERGQFDLLNVGTLYQVADILTKAFSSPSKWFHALRLIGIGEPLVGKDDKVRSFDKSAIAVAAQQHESSIEANRLLVEFCCSANSKLGQSRPASKGCKTIRVTEEEDGTSERCRQWLAHEIGVFRETHPEASILFYSSLPCVGGSPWGNVNSMTEEGSERIAEQQKIFAALLKSLCKILAEVADDKTFIAFELSKNCKYWKWPVVHKFVKRFQLELLPFHGCQFGVVGAKGKPMLKSWQVASNMETLFKLKEYKCNGQHDHDQSRGNSLKLAENYTFALTDFVHKAFHDAAAKAQKTQAKEQRLALAAMSAPSASVKAEPPNVVRDQWEDFFRHCGLTPLHGKWLH